MSEDKNIKKGTAAERFAEIEREVVRVKDGRLNSMLAPAFVSCDEERNSARISFEIKDWERNQRGEGHGGAISSMFDTAMGITVMAFSGAEAVSTADLSVSFIRPFLGQSCVIESQVLHAGRTLMRVRSEAFDQETGKCLASASGNFVRLVKR